MKHFVITVGCEFGSGGPEIGKMLAKSLGIEYYDRDLVDKVVEKIGVEKHLVEEADNKNFVPYGIETSLGTRYANLSNKVIYTQFDVIRKMAKTSCVIIGRCADYILREHENCLNVFVHADKAARIKRIVGLGHCEEDVLSYALFPKVAPKFFEYRSAHQTKIDSTMLNKDNKTMPV